MSRSLWVSREQLVPAVAGIALLVGPSSIGYSLACLSLALLAMLVPMPGRSVRRAWFYLVEQHPVLMSVLAVVLAVVVGVGAWLVVLVVPVATFGLVVFG